MPLLPFTALQITCVLLCIRLLLCEHPAWFPICKGNQISREAHISILHFLFSEFFLADVRGRARHPVLGGRHAALPAGPRCLSSPPLFTFMFTNSVVIPDNVQAFPGGPRCTNLQPLWSGMLTLMRPCLPT